MRGERDLHMLRTEWALVALAASATIASATVTTFNDGDTQGWGVFFENDGLIGDFYRETGGNDGGYLEFIQSSAFGYAFHNNTNRDVLGDYNRFGGSVSIGVDVLNTSVDRFGFESGRRLIIELVTEVDPRQVPGGRVSVWIIPRSYVSVSEGWTRVEAIIDDTSATTLPTNWRGTGAEDSNAEPILPDGFTFADVLSNVTEVRFTTYEPTRFYPATPYAIGFDNVRIGAVPAPAGMLALSGAGLMLTRRRRA